jgi:hypothetical protein
MTPTPTWDDLEAFIDWNLVERNRDAIAKSYTRTILEPPRDPYALEHLWPYKGEIAYE